jgi:hypothetical protein
MITNIIINTAITPNPILNYVDPFDILLFDGRTISEVKPVVGFAILSNRDRMLRAYTQ